MNGDTQFAKTFGQLITQHMYITKIINMEEIIERVNLFNYLGNVLSYEGESYVYRTVHHIYSRITIDQLDVTCFIISPFTAQHVSNVSTSIFRSLRFICELFHVLYCSGSMCVGVTVWFG